LTPWLIAPRDGGPRRSSSGKAGGSGTLGAKCPSDEVRPFPATGCKGQAGRLVARVAPSRRRRRARESRAEVDMCDIVPRRRLVAGRGGRPQEEPPIPLLSGKSQVLEDPGSRLAGLGQLPRRRRFTSAGRRARRSGSNRHPAPETIFEDGSPPCAHAPPSPRAGTAGPPPRRPPCRLPGSSSAR